MADPPLISKYPLSLRILHWLIALLVISLLAMGIIMTHLPRDYPYRGLLYALHKSLGLTVLGLAGLRLSLKLSLDTPPLPAIIPKIERALAHLGHAALYAFLFILPITGYTMSASYGLPVKWFGLAVPRLIGVDKGRGELAGNMHSFAAFALIAMIFAHAGAVLLHYVRRHLNLLRRMV